MIRSECFSFPPVHVKQLTVAALAALSLLPITSSLLPVAPVQAANLVLDSSFEDQSSRTVSPPWLVEGDGPKGIDIGLGFAAFGSNNAFIRTTSGWNAITQWITVKPMTQYTLTGWIRTSSNVKDGYFGVRDNTNLIIEETKYGPLTGYTKLFVTFNSGFNSTVLLFIGYWAPGADSWVQIDNLSIQ